MTKLLHKYRYFNIYILLAIFECILITGCRQAPTLEQKKRITPLTDDSLIIANKLAIQNEDQHIREYISRMGWKMHETGTGLRYVIIARGKGPKAKLGNVARINYELRLISGVLCYSSQKTGPKEFKIGSSGVESGLEEGILYLHKGDRAKFILPSHLAFGLIGDQDKIPGSCSIIYDVQLLDLN